MTGTDDKPTPPERRRGHGSPIARKRAARLAAVQALYEIDLAQANTETVLADVLRNRLGWEIDGERYVPADPALLSSIVRGARARRPELDALITAALGAKANPGRLELLIRTILYAGLYELVAHPEISAPIIISEYVDIGHAFFAGSEPGIINGILDHAARRLRTVELAGRLRTGAGAT